LIDLHTHCYFACNDNSVDADAIAARTGVTTWIDAGSCDAKTYRGFRRFIADQSQARIFGFIYGYPRAIDLTVNPLASATAQVDATGAAVRDNRDLFLGIKVQLGYNMQGQWTEGLADVGREVCDRFGLRMMMHVSYSPPETEFALKRLKPGDVMTHAFTGHGLKIVDDNGKLKPGVREARQRGVLFDIGHGMGSFSFAVARACLDHDFPPDTISSDIHQGSVNGPAFDLPTTMSKFLYLGMPLEECILRTTANAAKVLDDRVPGVGSLQEGGPADIALFQLEEGEFTLVDAMKQRVTAKQRIVNRLTICRGKRMLPRV
ncbi:MAG: amidohydrolase family protein, partial [Planctomycetes bacterium]|nr:amidohydrolase family protein [Planctomycetota bacterium]